MVCCVITLNCLMTFCIELKFDWNVSGEGFSVKSKLERDEVETRDFFPKQKLQRFITVENPVVLDVDGRFGVDEQLNQHAWLLGSSHFLQDSSRRRRASQSSLTAHKHAVNNKIKHLKQSVLSSAFSSASNVVSNRQRTVS